MTNFPSTTPALSTECLALSLNPESDLVRERDIAIVPLVADPFARGKRSFKAILSMSYAMPVVGSPIRMNKELIDHGRDGFLASPAEEWEACLTKLVDDPGLRVRMGECAREKIIRAYSVERTYPRL